MPDKRQRLPEASATTVAALSFSLPTCVAIILRHRIRSGTDTFLKTQWFTGLEIAPIKHQL
jgi:hypothetical protein